MSFSGGADDPDDDDEYARFSATFSGGGVDRPVSVELPDVELENVRGVEPREDPRVLPGGVST